MVEKSESLGTNIRVENKAALGDANDIARMQLRRFKRQVGTLTLDQELQIENLLFSTVAKISLLTRRAMENLVKNSPTK